jgi:hypothetical protein
MKIAIYTAIFGNYDKLKPAFPGYDCFCFTDQDFDEKDWKILQIDLLQSNCKFKTPERLTARKVKTLPHHYLPDYDAWLWVDGSVEVKKDPFELIQSTKEFTAHEHHISNIIQNFYREGINIVALNMEKPDRIIAQLNKYIQEGFVQKFPHYETAVVIRKNTPKVNNFNESWWEEIKNHSIRDQISLPYCLWKNDIQLQYFPKNILKNSYFKWEGSHQKIKLTNN